MLPLLVERELRRDPFIADILAEWPAPYALERISAQARWARGQL